MNEARLKELLGTVKEDGKITQQIMDSIVEHYSSSLDELISRINKFIRDLRAGNVDEYTDEEMELDILQISAEMYEANKELARLGGESDLAKQKRKDKFNDVVNRVAGTRQEKQAKAEQMILEEQILEDVYKRAYEQLKSKLEKADGVYTALKKVYHKRCLELDIFRKEIREKRFGSREEINDD